MDDHQKALMHRSQDSRTFRPRGRLLIAGIQCPPETFLTRLIEGLIQSGYQVTIGSHQRPRFQSGSVSWLPLPNWESPVLPRMLRLGVMWIRALVLGLGDVLRFRANLGGHAGFKDRMRRWNMLLPFCGRRWDIIYLPWNSAAVDLLPLFELATPIVISCRGTQASVAPLNPERSEFREGLTKTFQLAKAVHCVSQATMLQAKAFGLDPSRATIIRPAVDPSVFRPSGSDQGSRETFEIVCVGTLIWIKAHEWALVAVKKLIDRGVNARMHLIGDGPDRQRVLFTLDDLGLQSHVVWHGKLPPEQIIQRLQTSDVFLLSSHSEGISNAALEAMSCGLPVVTTDCGGMREAVADGVEGLIVPLRDPESMATALHRLALDPKLRTSMGKAARERVMRDFSLEAQLKAWCGLIEASMNTQPIHG